MNDKIIFYELNEVPKKVFETWSQLYPNSSFGILSRQSKKFETVAQDAGHLSPWVTWPSLHRGVSNVLHKISDIGQDLSSVNKEYPSVWEHLAKGGAKVGVFGSLQSYPLPEDVDNYSFYVPDTFAAGSECFPEKLSEFQSFNLGMVAQNAKDPTKGLRLKDAVRFLKSAPSLGLRASTVARLAGQLVSERVNDARTVRRRTSQAEIAFDFYYKALQTTQPDISFFFTNHVASAMHRYWPAMYPEDYEEQKYDLSWIRRWGDEIPHALRVADRQLSMLMKFVQNNSGWKLMVASSMGQEALQEAEVLNSQVLITDLERLLAKIGLEKSDYEINLAMVPQMVVTLNKSSVERIIKQLKLVQVNGQHLNCKEIGPKQIQIELNLKNQDELTVSYDSESFSPAEFGIEAVQLRDAAGANAYHIPQGIFLEYEPNQKSFDRKWDIVPSTYIAPMLLKNFQIAPPSYMAK